MFLADEKRTRLPVGVRHVVRLYRSINPVQVALPGFQGQKAGAFLCAFAVQGGLRLAVILELHDSNRLFFYLNEEGPVNPRAADALIEEGLYFAESMGFIMADLEVQKLPPAEREKQWRELPLAAGVPQRPVAAPAAGPPPTVPAISSPPGALFAPAPPRVRDRRDVGRRKGAAMDEDEFEARRQRLIVNVGRILAAY